MLAQLTEEFRKLLALRREKGCPADDELPQIYWLAICPIFQHVLHV